jgi:uncharacterized protein (TIGR04255 family)
MEPQPRYSRPPITEAIIDVRVTLPSGVTTDTLAQVQVGQEEAYPIRGDLFFQQTQLVPGTGIVPHPGPALIGHSFRSQEGKQIVQALMGGFVFSRLQPYEGWEPFRNEARRLWEVYRAVARPEAITRVAVRYVNRLDVPHPRADLKDYLRVLPDLPTGLPDTVSDFFMQLQVPQEALQSMLVLNVASLKPAPPGVASILLDIDLFRATELPQEEASLWDFLERLRTRKNQVFEECITERTRELIR